MRPKQSEVVPDELQDCSSEVKREAVLELALTPFF